MKKIILFFLLFTAFSSQAQVEIESQDIANYLDKEVIVKAKVAAIYYGKEDTKVVRLNMVENYPNEHFQLVIFKDKLELFGDLKQYEGKELTVKGKVNEHKKKFQIILNKPEQIQLSK
jgi:DNA/RNA endonuclease YhcR with UshA esterase domain